MPLSPGSLLETLPHHHAVGHFSSRLSPAMRCAVLVLTLQHGHTERRLGSEVSILILSLLFPLHALLLLPARHISLDIFLPLPMSPAVLTAQHPHPPSSQRTPYSTAGIDYSPANNLMARGMASESAGSSSQRSRPTAQVSLNGLHTYRPTIITTPRPPAPKVGNEK